ncbi:MAG: homocysteine S-methyltransferase family protein [Halanaerobiales bacterium]|nr:homocysteine S-methyltransferase family protein [Halanaerobiales bacterium]
MNFLNYVYNNDITLLDGAMGTELEKMNVMGNFANNIDNKEIVKKIHQGYIEAGSKAIITNTFSLNRIYLADKDLNLALINSQGVKIAKEVEGNDIFVLGDISSTGKLLQPYGRYKEEEFIKVFSEKAEILARAGVDAFIIETMVDLREAVCALKGCKRSSDLPVIVSISFDRLKGGGRTVMGDTVKESVIKLQEEEADIIGSNCGSLGPHQMAEVIKIMEEHTDLPILAKPNAGLPILQGKETLYIMEPADFTEGILACIEAGASLVGGCCGTTPEHIRDLHNTINK